MAVAGLEQVAGLDQQVGQTILSAIFQNTQFEEQLRQQQIAQMQQIIQNIKAREEQRDQARRSNRNQLISTGVGAAGAGLGAFAQISAANTLAGAGGKALGQTPLNAVSQANAGLGGSPQSILSNLNTFTGG